MKRIVHISALSAAILVLTALSLVPHHHHRSEVCMVMELCEADRTYNDRHTTHDTTGENAAGEGCALHTAYTRAAMPAATPTPDAQPAQAVGKAAAPTVPVPGQTVSKTDFALYILAYESVAPRSGGGLRAPPCLS